VADGGSDALIFNHAGRRTPSTILSSSGGI
jgi:hypothetical protein